jgi:hypothetical protein
MKKTNDSKAELVPGLDSNSNQKEQIAQRAYELWNSADVGTEMIGSIGLRQKSKSITKPPQRIN